MHREIIKIPGTKIPSQTKFVLKKHFNGVDLGVAKSKGKVETPLRLGFRESRRNRAIQSCGRTKPQTDNRISLKKASTGAVRMDLDNPNYRKDVKQKFKGAYFLQEKKKLGNYLSSSRMVWNSRGQCDEKIKMQSKINKVKAYWKRTSLLIPNVFRHVCQLHEDDEMLFEYLDLSKKELLVQANGLKAISQAGAPHLQRKNKESIHMSEEKSKSKKEKLVKHFQSEVNMNEPISLSLWNSKQRGQRRRRRGHQKDKLKIKKIKHESLGEDLKEMEVKVAQSKPQSDFAVQDIVCIQKVISQKSVSKKETSIKSIEILKNNVETESLREEEVPEPEQEEQEEQEEEEVMIVENPFKTNIELEELKLEQIFKEEKSKKDWCQDSLKNFNQKLSEFNLLLEKKEKLMEFQSEKCELNSSKSKTLQVKSKKKQQRKMSNISKKKMKDLKIKEYLEQKKKFEESSNCSQKKFKHEDKFNATSVIYPNVYSSYKSSNPFKLKVKDILKQEGHKEINWKKKKTGFLKNYVLNKSKKIKKVKSIPDNEQICKIEIKDLFKKLNHVENVSHQDFENKLLNSEISKATPKKISKRFDEDKPKTVKEIARSKRIIRKVSLSLKIKMLKGESSEPIENQVDSEFSEDSVCSLDEYKRKMTLKTEEEGKRNSLHLR